MWRNVGLLSIDLVGTNVIPQHHTKGGLPMNRTLSRRLSLLFIACLFLQISTFAGDFSIKEPKSTFSAVQDSFEMLTALVPASSSAAKPTDRPRTVIYNGAATQVAIDAESSNDLWITTADLKRATGFVIKPQGVCRDELCFPLPKNRKAAFVKKQGSTQWFNLSEFARLIGQPIASDHKNDVWCFGPRAAEQNGYITSLEAPDFTLPDMNGRQHSLKDFRGKKVLLITWASW